MMAVCSKCFGITSIPKRRRDGETLCLRCWTETTIEGSPFLQWSPTRDNEVLADFFAMKTVTVYKEVFHVSMKDMSMTEEQLCKFTEFMMNLKGND